MKTRAIGTITLFVLLLVAATGTTYAQRKPAHIVYLRNGSAIKGDVSESNQAQLIKIENDCGIWLVKTSEIDSIVAQRSARRNIQAMQAIRGYYNYSSLAGLFGSEKVPVPSFTTVNGWKFTQRLYTGVGLGYEYYDFGVVPLYADVRYVIGSDVVSPVLSAMGGYGFAVENKQLYYGWSSWHGQTAGETNGGLLLGAAAGINIRLGQRSALSVMIGHRYQILSYYDNGWGSETWRKVTTHYRRIQFSVGFTFF